MVLGIVPGCVEYSMYLCLGQVDAAGYLDGGGTF